MNKIFILFLTILLSGCIKKELMHPANTKQSNFELLWKIVDENYCYFDYKRINWDSIKTVYKPRVDTAKTKRALFDVYGAMLNELKDGHVNLSSEFNVSRYWDWYLDYPQNYNSSLLERNYLGSDYLIAGSLVMQKFNNVGYIYYSSFSSGFSATNLYSGLHKLGKIDGLIIDIRDNGGGLVSMSDLFTQCFLKEETLVGYTRYKQGPEHTDFSPYFSKRLAPLDGGPAFEGPIVLITNRSCYSSANDFTNSMKCLPNVTHIGDKTGGGGGLPFSSELYNGWSVRFSKDPLYDRNKNQIELGIEPDIYVDMDKTEEANGIDTILEEAIFKLSGKYFKK